MILLLAAVAVTAKEADAEGAEVRFEAEPAPAVMTLGLSRDGALTFDA